MTLPGGQGVMQAELKQKVVGGGQVAPPAQAALKGRCHEIFFRPSVFPH
jgi:hypothetical protein